MKKLLTLFALMLVCIGQTFAYDFVVNGIYYNKSGSNATVTYATSDYNSYSGIVVIPATVSYGGVTYNVTRIGDLAFFNSTGLTSVTIPNSVTSIGSSAFYGCSGLTSVTIPNSVTSIKSWAFSGCSGLTSITVDSGNTCYDSRDNCNAIIWTSGNTLIAGCKNTTIPNSVESIGDHAFSGCSGLTSVTIPNSVTSIKSWAFSGCSGLELIVIPASVTSIRSDAFNDCTSLTLFAVNKSNTVYSSEGGVLMDYNKTTVIRCPQGKTGSFTIPNSVTSIGDYAFYGCSGLTSITIPNSVESIGYHAFEYCSGLTSITIPNSVESIRDYTFVNCTGLTSVTIPNSVTSLGHDAFAGCNGLTSVTIPNSVTSLGHDAFSCCFGLTSVTIPNSVTSIGDYAFYQCSGLTSIIIPNSVTSIGTAAFEYCSGLTSVTIPNSVTSMEGSAFYGCIGLTSVTIGNSVESIGDLAFYGCSGLTSVTNMAVVPQPISSDTFSKYSGVTLHVLEGCKNEYAAANYWKNFTIVDDVPGIPVTSIKLSQATYSVELYGTTTASVATILPADASNKKVTWSSNDPSIAHINSQTGVITGLGDGVTTITATAVDGSGVTATALVKVGDAAIVYVSSIELSQSSYSLTVGGSLTASVANILPADATAKSVTWSSNDPTVATINSSTGEITGMQEGTTTITATAIDGSGVTATATVNVSTPEIYKGIKLNQLFGFSTPIRGAWTMVDTTLKGTGQSGVNQTVDVQNTNQQFALYMYKGQVYLWSQSAQHFLNNSGQAVSILNASPVAWTAEEGDTFFFHFTDAADKYINLGGSKEIAINYWNYADAGNKMTLTPVKGFDLAAVQAVIADDVPPVRTIVDGETYTATAAKDYGKVTYTRTFDNLNWQALYVPFSMDYDEWSEKYDIAEIHNFIEYDDDENGTFDRTYLVVLKKTSGSTEPNYPYLIRAKETGTHSLVLTDKTLEAAESTSIDCSSVKNRYTFTGTYAKVEDMYANGYWALSGGVLYKANAASVTLNPQRWYMALTSRTGGASTKAQSIRILVDGEDDTTDISLTKSPFKGDLEGRYDLMGRMLSPFKGERGEGPRGVNIVNGKKLIK